MKRWFHMVFLLTLAFPLWGQEPERWLDELDAELERKGEYDAQKEERIARLRGSLRSALDDMDRYGTTRALFEEYKSYKYDSAFAYATRMGELAARLESPDSRVEAGCATVFCLISAGLYKEAFDMLDGLSVEGASPKGLLEYYRMQVKLNYSARGYSQTEPYWSQYTRTAEAYTRKIMETVPPDSPLWYRYNANLLMEETRFDEGIEAYRQLLSDKTLDLHSRAIYASSLGWMLHCQGREDEAVEALCESAICDLQSSTKETTALRMLAEYLSLQGEVDRPSRYVHESFDDANFYNARLRKLEVGAVLPIVEKNHYDTLRRERNGLVLSVILAILVILAAIAALWFIRRQNRRLHEARKTIGERNAQLEAANAQLETANAQLAEANEIKSEYIGNSFYINAEFIDKMAQLYKTVDRMIVTRQYDELRRSLKESTIDKERDEMYASFDATFLKIFPTFVNDYNALFPEAEQRYPAGGLTPEMRIFALIRLGITETDRIAKFLDYSVHTINTYKTRVKNKSWVENELFEAEIMKIGLR